MYDNFVLQILLEGKQNAYEYVLLWMPHMIE